MTADSAGSSADYALRVFLPWLGIDEDPVTGSMATVVAPWFQQAGYTRSNHMRSLQCSHRPGELGIEVCGKDVKITGATTVVMAGQLLL